MQAIHSECGICKRDVDHATPHFGCLTEDCSKPFILHDKCLKKKMKSKPSLEIKCSSCEQSTSWSKLERKPVWEFFGISTTMLFRLGAFFLLSFLPYGVLFYFGNPERLDRPLWVWALVSWIVVGLLWVVVKLSLLVTRVVSAPARGVLSFVLSLIPGGRSETEGEIVATTRKHK